MERKKIKIVVMGTMPLMDRPKKSREMQFDPARMSVIPTLEKKPEPQANMYVPMAGGKRGRRQAVEMEMDPARTTIYREGFALKKDVE